METTQLGHLREIGRLTLGGGGIGQVWGATSRDEAIETVYDAYTGGINLFDMAPLYGRGEAETVMGLAFSEGYPEAVRVTTKCMVGGIDAGEIEGKLRTSLDESCERLKRNSVDLFILHGYVIPDGWQDSIRPKLLRHIGVEWSNYQDHVIRTFEQLKSEGRIGGWGITAASVQSMNLAVMEADQKPDVIQAISNLLDSPGGMAISAEHANPRAVIQKAKQQGIGVMGIRAVAAGSLTDSLDRELEPESHEVKDFERSAPFRDVAKKHGVSAAFLAHRYALAMPGVDTLVLGVKDRTELYECLAAEKAGPLGTEVVLEIDEAVANRL
ncbi:MAG: aryl-alcohol dehydrogenase-like predicted oxidoreductase [Patiriisocius sp.]|jgi:aryl-alcohol dehydrogenase-like predicted oxidoreductase